MEQSRKALDSELKKVKSMLEVTQVGLCEKSVRTRFLKLMILIRITVISTFH